MSDLTEPSIETGCQGVEKLETAEEYQGIDSGRRGHRRNRENQRGQVANGIPFDLSS